MREAGPTLLERLSADGYRVEERWYTRDVLGFVRRELSRPRWPLKAAFAFMGAVVAYSLYRGVADVGAGAAWARAVLLPFGVGAFGVLLLVTPHELLHGLAFKALGARRVVFGAEWRQLVFHASAPGFALRPRQMDVVALTPFAVLTPVLSAVIAYGSPWWQWVGLGALLMHTQGCLGDFAMVNYFVRLGPAARGLLTFDEEGGGSFVFVRRAGSEN